MINVNERLQKALTDLNPWWKSRDFEVEYRPREIYPLIKKYQPLRQIIALTGLRRVGKTTLLKKVIDDLLTEGIQPAHILFFSYDDFQDVEIEEVLHAYQGLLPIDIAKDKCYLFFDEIQKLASWQEKAKRVYDTFPRLKMYISGSESLLLLKEANESLAGRIFTFKVELLSFQEYLGFKGLSFPNPALYKKEIMRELDQFYQSGGFPELIAITDREIAKRYFRETIIEKLIYKDIPQLFKIENPSVLEAILNIIISNPGQLMDLQSLSREIGISRQTLASYLSYLEKAFLVIKLYNFS
ncbi:MAG: ATP-binding protein, partial [Nanoarchaeota archaeon]